MGSHYSKSKKEILRTIFQEPKAREDFISHALRGGIDPEKAVKALSLLPGIKERIDPQALTLSKAIETLRAKGIRLVAEWVEIEDHAYGVELTIRPDGKYVMSFVNIKEIASVEGDDYVQLKSMCEINLKEYLAEMIAQGKDIPSNDCSGDFTISIPHAEVSLLGNLLV